MGTMFDKWDLFNKIIKMVYSDEEKLQIFS